MQNISFLLVCLVAFDASAADAQANNAMSVNWNGFVRECNKVVEDYEGYRTSLPRPGPLGESVEVITADGRVSNISTSVDGLAINLYAFWLNGTVNVSCTIGSAFQSQTEVAEISRMFTALLDSNGIEYVGGNIAGDSVSAEPSLAVYQAEPWHTYELSNFFPQPVDQITASFGEWSISFSVGFTRTAPQ